MCLIREQRQPKVGTEPTLVATLGRPCKMGVLRVARHTQDDRIQSCESRCRIRESDKLRRTLGHKREKFEWRQDLGRGVGMRRAYDEGEVQRIEKEDDPVAEMPSVSVLDPLVSAATWQERGFAHHFPR